MLVFARVSVRVMPIGVEDAHRRGELLDADVAERDLVGGAVVLQADVAGGQPTGGRVRPRVHGLAVEPDRVRAALVADLVVVPLPRGLGVALVLAVGVVDRPRLLVLAVAGHALADLDLVTLVDRDVRVGSRVREADEDARVVRGVGRLELQAQDEVVVRLRVEPEQAEAVAALQRAALRLFDEVEATRPGLGGPGEVEAVPQPCETVLDRAVGRTGQGGIPVPAPRSLDQRTHTSTPLLQKPATSVWTAFPLRFSPCGIQQRLGVSYH